MTIFSPAPTIRRLLQGARLTDFPPYCRRKGRTRDFPFHRISTFGGFRTWVRRVRRTTSPHPTAMVWGGWFASRALIKELAARKLEV